MRRSPTAGSDGPASSLSGRRRRSGGDAERAPLLEEAGERRPLRCSISPSCRLVASVSSASVSSRLSLKRLLKRCSAGLSTAGKQSRCWDVPRWWDVCSARVVFLASSISSVISDVCHGIPATALGPRLLAKTCSGMGLLKKPFLQKLRVESSLLTKPYSSKKTYSSKTCIGHVSDKYACYLWEGLGEGYRRHTGPELHTGGMRGSNTSSVQVSMRLETTTVPGQP